MGFNISGLAINKNYEKDFDQLQNELGWKLEKQSEIDFETASTNWTEEGICNVYFTENGTLIFLEMDMCDEPFPLKNDNTLTFALSETSMAFNIIYCENGVEKRSIMEFNDNRMTDDGERLAVEDLSEDPSEIIWNQIERVIGKKFWDIEPDEKAVCYVFSNNIEAIIPEISNSIETTIPEKKTYDIDQPIPKEVLSNEFTDDDLFQYFDKIIAFAQNNQINAFFVPWTHEGNTRKFINLHGIITEISNRPHLSNQISQKLPLDRFEQLCKLNPDNIDANLRKKLMRELNFINNYDTNEGLEAKIKLEKKWWEFWK